MMRHFKFRYGEDESGQGFFCPEMHQKRIDYFALKMLRPSEAEAVYQCRPGAKTGSIFVEKDFRYFEAPAGLEVGVGAPTVVKWLQEKGAYIAQGWDTAISAASYSDRSACVTIAMVPCEQFHRDLEAITIGHCDQHYDVYLLDVFRDRLEIGDLILEVRRQAMKWNPEKIIVEKKASGASVIQALANTGLPIEGVVPQENKRDRAINGGAGAGSVQGWFRAGRVLFPRFSNGGAYEFAGFLPPLVRELKDFTGEKGATDDQVDALVHVVGYAIREGSSGVRFPDGWRTVEDVDARMMDAPFGMAASFDVFQALDPGRQKEDGVLFDPFRETCSHCIKFNRAYCTQHKRPVTGINPACPTFDDGTAMSSFPHF